MKIPESVVDQARSVSLVALLQRYQWQPVRNHPNDTCGPCPFCGGGEDRFWIKDNRYKCRVCGVHGTPVDFVMKIERVEFQEAVKMLTNYTAERTETALNGAQNGKGYKDTPKPLNALPALPAAPQAKRKEPPMAEWIAEATAIAEECHERLMTSTLSGCDYLMSRGINQDSWLAFRLGFHPAVPVGSETRPAISIPWYRGGKVLAIRYRFLRPFEEPKADGTMRKRKITSKKGSYFTGYVYGGHALPDFVSPDSSVLGLRTLIIHEGELNAISSWQVVRGWRWDVLSVGGENEAEHLPQGVIDFARKYERVICWMDRPEIAKAAMAQIPGSYGITSPVQDGSKIDANDMLKRGLLAGFLAEARRKACESDTERERLYWNLMDDFDAGHIDDGALLVAAKLAGQLGLDRE